MVKITPSQILELTLATIQLRQVQLENLKLNIQLNTKNFCYYFWKNINIITSTSNLNNCIIVVFQYNWKFTIIII